jgi:hypothetical protein
MKIVGIDFTCAPSARKPITMAVGCFAAQADTGLCDATLHITEHVRLRTLQDLERWLALPDAWTAGFDMPFGLPRPFLQAQGWGVLADPAAPQPSWSEVTARIAALSRLELVARCRAWTSVREVGDKFAHRGTDRPAGSSTSMKWVNPPLALMLHAGAPRLLACGATIPGLRRGDPSRIALEAYPGMLARRVTGRASYKSDDRRKDDSPRRAAREAIVAALDSGAHAMRIAVTFAEGLRAACLADASGDTLDAVICAVESAWGWLRRDCNYGLPADMDPLEGWIVGAV